MITVALIVRHLELNSVEKQDKISDKLAMEEETARTARSKHVANRKQQTYADAVKSHTEVVMNEMLDHLIQ